MLCPGLNTEHKRLRFKTPLFDLNGCVSTKGSELTEAYTLVAIDSGGLVLSSKLNIGKPQI